MRYMTRLDVKTAFVKRGWVAAAGGQLYYNGHNTTAHPHFHMSISDSSNLVPIGRDIRLAVIMFAWSDGGQHAGGGGQTFIHGGRALTRLWRKYWEDLEMNDAMTREFSWIMSYFTEG